MTLGSYLLMITFKPRIGPKFINIPHLHHWKKTGYGFSKELHDYETQPEKVERKFSEATKVKRA